MRKVTQHSGWEVLHWPFLWEEPRRFFPRSVLHAWGDYCLSLLARLQYHLVRSSLAAWHPPCPLYWAGQGESIAFIMPRDSRWEIRDGRPARPTAAEAPSPRGLRSGAALPNAGVPSSADSAVRLPPRRGSGTPTWHRLGMAWARWNGHESRVAPAASRLHCKAVHQVPTPVQEEPGLAMSTPTFPTGHSYFTLVFHKAVQYGRDKLMGSPHLQ